MVFHLQRLMNLVPRWERLNAFGRIRIFQSSYFFFVLVPIVAKLIHKLGPELEMNLFGAVFHVSLGLPFSWKVFYFSSFCFVVAISIYWGYCPQIIKDFRNFREFQEEGRGQETIKKAFLEYLESLHNNSELKLVISNTFIEQFCEPPPELDVKYSSALGLVDEAAARVTDAPLKPEKLSEAFWFTRSLTDKIHPRIRLSCSSSYLLAFILLLIVLIQNFIYVSKLTF